MPDRRTITVLGSLLVAMTVTSGLLLLLEPTPSSPQANLPQLTASSQSYNAENLLFNTSAPYLGWEGIVIHDSRRLSGSAKSIDQEHTNAGLGGLGYHFVLGNGKGSEDGQIEIGFRWQHQYVGAHSGGPQGDWRNRRAISICLVGDGDREPLTEKQIDSLTWLVRQLQQQFQISADRVIIETDRTDGGAGRLFPVAGFRRQLDRTAGR